jgi:protein-L-isoaspartate(D-aspartate) O-methyltransferase
MVIPVGERYQQTLFLMRKTKGELQSEALRPTLFVPMTGEAEDKRRVKPDPNNPQLTNGSFEELQEQPGRQQPAGWHYQQQLTLKADAQGAPDGKNFVLFRNTEPGRGCQALQGFAVDGRKVSAIQVSARVRAQNIQLGARRDQIPAIIVTFYDERRATVGEASLGPFVGSFDWQEQSGLLRVPIRAREAILRIGLLGATGELSVDDVRLQAG